MCIEAASLECRTGIQPVPTGIWLVSTDTFQTIPSRRYQHALSYAAIVPYRLEAYATLLAVPPAWELPWLNRPSSIRVQNTGSHRRRRSGKPFLKANCDFFSGTSVISSSFKGALIQEFEIPGRQFRCRWRHQYRRLTAHKAALKGSLWAQHLVITDVSDEIFRQSDKSKLSGSNAELL